MTALRHSSTTPFGPATSSVAVAHATKAAGRAMSWCGPDTRRLRGTGTAVNDINALLARYPL